MRKDPDIMTSTAKETINVSSVTEEDTGQQSVEPESSQTSATSEDILDTKREIDPEVVMKVISIEGEEGLEEVSQIDLIQAVLLQDQEVLLMIEN